MAKGLVLHLRCFLEGVEVPISSCSVSAAMGGPASAHIELLDSELAFNLLPRTLVHVFFFDDKDGHPTSEPDLYAGDRGASSKYSNDYKLLFCGELFSVFHNKSGHGNRSLTIMALDVSNVLDTSYIFQVSYSNVDGALGSGAAAEASFVAASSITNNPFDNIINSPQEVIKHIARRKASSAVHAQRVSRVGGLFSIFELLLGVEGYSLGMNLWTSIHESMVRLIDMMASDTGKTAQKLFDDTIFNEWLTNSVSNQAPSMSYRELATLIMRYIYYDMVSIPTASYYTPAAGTGRDSYDVEPSGITVPSEFRDYFGSSDEFNQASYMDPEFLANVVEVVQKLRDKGYKSTVITSGFRTSAEADALYGSNSFKSPHSKGIAADIDWGDIYLDGTYIGNMFRMGNVALSKHRDIQDKPAALSLLRAEGYIKADATTVTDARIMRFLLDFNDQDADWVAAEAELSSLLFGGAIQNTYQFLHYMLVYPFMSSCTMPSDGRDWWVSRRNESLDRYIDTWRLGFRRKKFVGTRLLSTNSNSMIRGMLPNNPAAVWLKSWVTTHSDTISGLFAAASPATTATASELYHIGGSTANKTISFDLPGGLCDPAPYIVNGTKNSVMGLRLTAHQATMDDIWHTYYTEKVKFWVDKGTTVDEVSATKEPKMFSGANRMILSGKPTYTPTMFFIFFDKAVTGVKTSGGGIGDDPVHIQSRRSFTVESTEDYVSQARAAALYATRERMTSFLIRPDIWMCAPPKCNVIFPEDIVSLNISRELMRQTTRTFLMTYDQLYADNVLFNGHYFAPQFEGDLPSIQQKAFGLSTSNEVIYPHEVYSGIIPKVNRISEVAFYSKATTVKSADQQLLQPADLTNINQYTDNETKMAALSEKASPSTYDFVRAYASDVAHFNLMKQRYTANRVTVNARFLPMLVPGLPAVVIGQNRAGSYVGPKDNRKFEYSGFTSTHTWLGMIESVQHSYSQGGANTSVSLSTCRPYNTGSDSIDELLKLKKEGKNLFTTQDPSNRVAFGTAVDGVPSYLTFATRPRLESTLTTFEHIIDKVPESMFGFWGHPFFLNPEDIIKVVTDLCSSSAYESTYVDTTGAYPRAKFATVTRASDGATSPITMSMSIGRNTTGQNTPSPYDLTTISPGSNYIFKAVFYTSIHFSPQLLTHFGNNTPVYSLFDGINFKGTSAEDKRIATQACEDVATLLQDSVNAVISSNEFLIKSGDVYKKITEMTRKPQPNPTLGNLVIEFDIVGSGIYSAYIDTSVNNILTKDTPDSMLDVEIVVTQDGLGVATIPILLATETYDIKVGPTESTNTGSNDTSTRSVPLEEAIMPAWLSDEYKNGSITANTDVISLGKASIDPSTGIGALYRTWFSCDSILDDVPYNNKSIYSTVTIEDAVDNLISKYAKKTLGGTYNYTKRNIATLTNMLAPIKKEEQDGKGIPKTGGYHARSVGDYANLELLGLTDKPLKGSLTTETKVTISTLTPEKIKEGLSLDPRKERLARVKKYKNDVTKQRGKQG